MKLRELIQSADKFRPQNEAINKGFNLRESNRFAHERLEAENAAALKAKNNFNSYYLPIFKEVGSAKNVTVTPSGKYINDAPCFTVSQYTHLDPSGNYYMSEVTGRITWGYEYSNRIIPRGFLRKSQTILTVDKYRYLEMIAGSYDYSERSIQELWEYARKQTVLNDGSISVGGNSSFEVGPP